jgi:hypothetical protein
MRAVRVKARFFITVFFTVFVATNLPGQAVQGLASVRVASGLNQPRFVSSPPGDYNRLFIVQKTGQVWILNLPNGTLNTTSFLDISARITTASEQGLLLCLAGHTFLQVNGVPFKSHHQGDGQFDAAIYDHRHHDCRWRWLVPIRRRERR